MEKRMDKNEQDLSDTVTISIGLMCVRGMFERK